MGSVKFNLNYFRPHTFGLEAEPEVSAFVEAFGCTIRDPQWDGMAEGPYTAAGFLHGWNKGNASGYGAIGTMHGLDNVLVVEEQLIERTWRWNFGLKKREAGISGDRFLPHAMWGKRLNDGVPIVFAVWLQGAWIAFPDCVTHALLVRKRSVDDGTSAGPKNMMEAKLISMEEIASLEDCGWREIGGDKLLLGPLDARPSHKQISMFDGPLSEPNTIIQKFSPDCVLGASLMAEAVKDCEK